MTMKARLDNEFDQGPTLKGKHADAMTSMMDTRGRKQENFMQQMMQTLDQNKKRYDRQLYSDWLTQVYSRCQSACIKGELGAHSTDRLRDVEKQCGRNCIRKYDKVYKLYDNVEGKVLISFVEDNQIDADDLVK